MDDVAFHYRMVDCYYEHNDLVVAAPRCGEHRDFGSFTLIQSTHRGLQVNMDDKWHDVPLVPEGSAILIFGWCTQIALFQRSHSCPLAQGG
jgi:isopenicillin N synthase-like dioxygenase